MIKKKTVEFGAESKAHYFPSFDKHFLKNYQKKSSICLNSNQNPLKHIIFRNFDKHFLKNYSKKSLKQSI